MTVTLLYEIANNQNNIIRNSMHNYYNYYNNINYTNIINT